MFSWVLAASIGGASSLMQGEQSWENPSRSLGIKSWFCHLLTLIVLHQVCHSLSLGLSFPICQTSTKPEVPLALTILEFRCPILPHNGVPGPPVQVLEEGKGNQ